MAELLKNTADKLLTILTFFPSQTLYFLEQNLITKSHNKQHQMKKKENKLTQFSSGSRVQAVIVSNTVIERIIVNIFSWMA